MESKTPSVLIRHAEIEDLENASLLFDAYRQFYNQESDLPAARQFLADRLKNQESVFFLSEIDNLPVGFAQLYPMFSSVSLKRVWVLNDLLVLPNWRNLGIGSALLDHVKKFAKATAAKSIILETAPDNQPAKKLYELHGYVQDEQYLHFALNLSR